MDNRIITISTVNVNKAKDLLNDYAVAAQNNTLGDYSQAGILYHVLDALDMRIVTPFDYNN